MFTVEDDDDTATVRCDWPALEWSDANREPEPKEEPVDEEDKDPDSIS